MGSKHAATIRCECKYLQKSPSMDAMARTRAPYLVKLFRRLADECQIALLSLDVRLYQVWFHLIFITYYIGEPGFVDALLGFDDKDNLERVSAWRIFVECVQGK